MTQLVPQEKVESADLLKDSDSLTSLLERLVGSKPLAKPEKPAVTPKVIPLSDASKQAVKRLSVTLGAVELPSKRRLLTKAEQDELIQLQQDVAMAEKALKKAREAAKEAVFNHLDIGLEKDNDPDSLPVDPKTGHYLVKGELEVAGTGKKFCRELRQGTPDVSEEHVKALLDAEIISKEQYLKATRQTRVLDEEGLLSVLKDDPTLLTHLDAIIETPTPIASFIVRDVKK